MSIIHIEKQEDIELSVPTEWRTALKNLAEFFVFNDPLIQEERVSVDQIDEEIVKINRGNLNNYPEAIGRLIDRTWETSIYTWTGSYWAVLVDLMTSEGEASDLVMHAKIREFKNRYLINAGLVYVP